jgi:hypothetical protein
MFGRLLQGLAIVTGLAFATGSPAELHARSTAPMQRGAWVDCYKIVRYPNGKQSTFREYSKWFPNEGDARAEKTRINAKPSYEVGGSRVSFMARVRP